MYTQLLCIFGIFTTAALASASAPGPTPTIAPGALFAVGDNVIAAGVEILSQGYSTDASPPTWTNAHTFTLNLTKGAWEDIGISLWTPPPPGSTVPASPSGTPTAVIMVSPWVCPVDAGIDEDCNTVQGFSNRHAQWK